MLKEETLKLIDIEKASFNEIFSICIGKMFVNQARFIDYIGDYSRWDTDVTQGKLLLDNREFSVEYIGTTSSSDPYWYSADIEKVIPEEYSNIISKVRNELSKYNIPLANSKIELQGNVNGYNLSMIYMAFAMENVAYFNGSGDVSVYMFVKNLPDSIFKKINSVEFSNKVMQIISQFSVNHRLLIKAMLIENEIKFEESEEEIVAEFNNESNLTIKFEDGFIKSISGNVNNK